MMTDTEILLEMIKEEARPRIQANHSIELREKQEQDSKVTISKIPRDAVVIKADIFKEPKSIFMNSRNECKRADYVIISEEKKRIVYIEVKLEKAHSGKDVIRQLWGAKCFIAYCREIGIGFWENSDFLKNYQERFIVFSHTSARKRMVRLPRIPASRSHNAPGNPLKLPGVRHIPFDEIAS